MCKKPASFLKKQFLLEHIEKTLAFYDKNVDDPNGGFYQNFSDDGTIFDHHSRHLVSSCRFIYNYSRAYLQFGKQKDKTRVESGIAFLREKHFNSKTGAYAWTVEVRENGFQTTDNTNYCYGMAFVILAYSWALRVGIERSDEYLDETWDFMENIYWDNEHGLYKDEFNQDFSTCSPYRGQNSNMHTCEALIAAYQSTKKIRYIERAYLLANHIVNRQAKLTDDLVWEHFTCDWKVDWNYNKNDAKNLFKPWGFQPGHQTEWAKLLLFIFKYKKEKWLVERAVELFDQAMHFAYDKNDGGICYGFSPKGDVCDGDKYFWVQAESFAAAALLGMTTGEEKYWDWYSRIWQYSWDHLIDHKYGAWYRILSSKNVKLENTKSPLGKTDYHTMGACYDVIEYCLSS